MLQTVFAVFFHHPRSRHGWRAVLGLLIGVITWLALSPAPPPRADLGWDKLNHLAAFATLAVVALWGRCGAFWQVGTGLLAYGGLIEVLQSFTPQRVGEWPDVLADGLGIAAGLLLVAGGRRLAAFAGLPLR